MAGVGWIAVPAAVVPCDVNPMTVLQVLAASNHRAQVTEWGVSFDGLDPVGAKILVKLCVQSTAGTSGVALTLEKAHSGDPETIQTTALEDIDGTQPTLTRVLDWHYVHPQGSYVWQAPYEGAWDAVGGARIGIVVASSDATLNCAPHMHGKE